jgi:uncharacterized protein
MTDAELVSDFYATWNQDHLAEDVEWRMAEGFPSDGHYRGRRAVFEEWWPRHAELFPEWRAEPEHVLGAGEAVVVLGTYRGRASTSDLRVAVPFAHVWWMKNGKIAKFEQHTNTLLLDRALAPPKADTGSGGNAQG